ncbi:uncharacterized protein N7483_010005 [Penicillium malachiteum]|uniref:uncharacterized protein n=1 Tax=Penicillium malachiteum TaxID=1324776 RepID=UPI002549AC48|nr:uncharacterized protein N7483_010005 [Penicillium malachiteum]KAJ5718923.1 hypothetical protein N7483_010005 [Penicillium malachiteum]
MAYAHFHRPHYRSNPLPVFHDLDGSPIYEYSDQGLLCTIIRRNELTALNSYNECAHTRVFCKAYEFDDSNPFHIAIQSDSFDVLRELFRIYLSDSELIETLEDYLKRFHSPVIEACATANREMVLWLMDHDPPLGKLHDHDFEGQTALLRAAEALKEAGNSALEAKPADSQTAHQHCKRIESFISWLLDNDCSLETNLYDEWYEADEQDESDCVPMPRGTVLGDAVSYAGYELVSRLIAKGADVHGRQNWTGGPLFEITHAHNVTALHIAALSWNVEAIRALIDHRGEVEAADMVVGLDSYGRHPLHWALTGISSNYADSANSDDISSRMNGTLKLLLDIKPDSVYTRERHGATVFHYALHNNTGHGANIGAIKLLLHTNQLPDTLNFRNNVGAIALGEALEQHQFVPGDLEIVSEILKILLKNGADLRACDNLGRNVLQKLCSISWLESILTSSGVDRMLDHLHINEKDDLGCTALHYLVRHLDQVDAIRHFVLRGADVNAVDLKGNTPLHEAMKGTIIKRMEEPGNREEINERLRQALHYKRDLSFKSCQILAPPKKWSTQRGRRRNKYWMVLRKSVHVDWQLRMQAVEEVR